MITVSHLSLLPDVEPDALCVICGSGRPDVQCERCAASMHWDCYWERVPSAERAALAAAVAEANAPGPTQTVAAVSVDGHRFQFDVRLERRPCDGFLERLLIVCPGCRS